MHCPKCSKINLQERRAKRTGIRVDCCPGCRGIWFDGDELDRLLSVAVEKLRVPPDAERTDRFCPRCADRLHRFLYPQTLVKVDMCKKCAGLWLDAGELVEVRTVRSKLERDGELDKRPPPSGVKGALLRFIDTALGQMDFS